MVEGVVRTAVSRQVLNSTNRICRRVLRRYKQKYVVFAARAQHVYAMHAVMHMLCAHAARGPPTEQVRLSETYTNNNE